MILLPRSVYAPIFLCFNLPKVSVNSLFDFSKFNRFTSRRLSI